MGLTRKEFDAAMPVDFTEERELAFSRLADVALDAASEAGFGVLLISALGSGATGHVLQATNNRIWSAQLPAVLRAFADAIEEAGESEPMLEVQ